MNLPEQQEQKLVPSALTWVEILLKVNGVDTNAATDLNRLSPASLAYIGDAVFELYIRTLYLLPPKRIVDYHNLVVAQVRAETQATYLKTLDAHLTEMEREIVRRGRNAAKGHPRRLSPDLYQKASGLETLIGYLYLKNPQRLQELLTKLEIDRV
ncbi:MAG: Mini-ribonuclease 3 [Xenococcaceae cyanobacterium]